MLTRNQTLILSILFVHPDREFYIREIGKLLNKEPGTFQKAITSLECDNVILSRKYGNQKLIKLNLKHPLLKEYKSIIEKTSGVPAVLASAFSEMKDVSLVLIFGSYAKNMLRSSSDIDLLVVGETASENRVLEITEKVGRRVMREINYKFYTSDEFVKRQKKDPFLKEVLADKFILLKGNV